MKNEAAYLRAIHRALELHEHRCGDEPTAILLHPDAHSRLDWPEYRGIPVEPSADVPAGVIRIDCAGVGTPAMRELDDAYDDLDQKLDRLGELFDRWRTVNEDRSNAFRRDRQRFDEIAADLDEPGEDFDELYRRLRPSMPSIRREYRAVYRREPAGTAGDRVIQRWSTGVTAAAPGYEPTEPGLLTRLSRAISRAMSRLIALISRRRRDS